MRAVSSAICTSGDPVSPAPVAYAAMIAALSMAPSASSTGWVAGALVFATLSSSPRLRSRRAAAPGV